MKRRHFLTTAGTAAGALALPIRAFADTFPSRPIKLIVPAPAGGSTDALARLVGNKLNELYGATVLVENRAGGNSIIGIKAVASAPPDGYTLLLHSNTIVQLPTLYKRPPYDLAREMQPVGGLALSRNVLAVLPQEKSQTLADFVKAAKAQPDTYNYGSYGIGTASNIYGELLKRQTQMPLTHIPYRGASPLLIDLMGGQVRSAFVDIGTARQYIATNKIRVLAVTGPSRLQDLPNVPTFVELGYRGFEPSGWFGLFAPAKTTPAAMTWFQTALARVVAQPDVQTQIAAMGLVPTKETPAAFAATVRADSETWAGIIREVDIQIDE